MDFLKKGQDMLNSQTGGNNNTQQQQQPQGGQQQQPGQGSAQNTQQAGGEDYGDKGLDFLEKKTGQNFGRDTNEKITDGARGLYEKATGSKVDAKYSN